MQAWIDSESEGGIRTPTMMELESPCTPIICRSNQHTLQDSYSTTDSRTSTLSSCSIRTPSSKASYRQISQFNSSTRRSSMELSPCEDFYRSFEIKPSEFSLEVFRQDRVRLDNKREIKAVIDSSSLNVTDLRSLKELDPDTFENLRRNGYRREDNKSTRLCELF